MHLLNDSIIGLYDRIKSLVKSKGYAWFEGNHNLNLIAVRNNIDPVNNTFDDTLYVCYTNERNEKIIHSMKCTVDPGTHWLRNPMDKGGTAAIHEGQYRGLWKLGTFQGHPALIQQKNVRIYRDNNKNDIFEYNSENTTVGMYGIFLHPSFQGEFAKNVDKSSAGCVVPQRLTDFYYLISLCRMQYKCGFSDTFSLTMLKQTDLN